MTTRLTRRNLFGAAAAIAVAAPVAVEAQTSKDDDLKSARDSIANNSAQLAKIEVPIATEPAFVFKTQ